MSNQRRTIEDIEIGEEFLQGELRNQAGEMLQQGENQIMVCCRVTEPPEKPAAR